jgi:CRP-like cAMP-binding protein
MPDLQLVQYLRRVPLFAKLSDAELGGLAERMRQKAFKRGDTIFRKDDPGQHFYVVLEGAVKIATALEDTRCALLAGDDFLSFVEANPAATKVVLEALAKTVRRLSDRVEDLIFLDVPSRVAKYLLDLAQANGAGGSGELELTLTQDELAAFTGASRVSVNRVLGDLERRDLISIRRRKIAIRDPEKLAKEIRV